MTTAHTPTPWEKCGGATPYYTCITSGGEYIVFGMADNQVHKEHGSKIKSPDMWTQQANAAHIVKCVNMHDELVEALERARVYMKEEFNNIDDSGEEFSIVEQIEKALKKAGEL